MITSECRQVVQRIFHGLRYLAMSVSMEACRVEYRCRSQRSVPSIQSRLSIPDDQVER
jgi:hypothetical protein